MGQCLTLNSTIVASSPFGAVKLFSYTCSSNIICGAEFRNSACNCQNSGEKSRKDCIDIRVSLLTILKRKPSTKRNLNQLLSCHHFILLHHHHHHQSIFIHCHFSHPIQTSWRLVDELYQAEAYYTVQPRFNDTEGYQKIIRRYIICYKEVIHRLRWSTNRFDKF